MGRRARRRQEQEQQKVWCEVCGCEMPADHRDAIASAQTTVAGVEVH